jgi:hypothetical protein
MSTNGNWYSIPTTIPSRDGSNNNVDAPVTNDLLASISGRAGNRFIEGWVRLVLPYVAQAWDAMHPPKPVPGAFFFDTDGGGTL